MRKCCGRSASTARDLKHSDFFEREKDGTHGVGDLLVPLSQEQTYAREVAAHGESNLLVQRAIREADHCEYSTVETAQGWHDVVSWVRTGHKPCGDDLLNPKAVASPTFGCRYTDPGAYDDPADYRTRSLYPRCP